MNNQRILDTADEINWYSMSMEMLPIEILRRFSDHIHWAYLIKSGGMTTEIGMEFQREIGYISYWEDGESHRTDGPAKIYPGGTTIWYYKGKLHRVGGPSLKSDSEERWVLHGKRHRVGGPALSLLSGFKEWYFLGNLHNEEGPAVIQPNKENKYFLCGVSVDKERWERLMSIPKNIVELHKWKKEIMDNLHE